MPHSCCHLHLLLLACLVCLCSQGVPGGPLNGISVATCRKLNGMRPTDCRLKFSVGMESSDSTINTGNTLPYHRKSMRAMALVAADAKWKGKLLGNTPVNRVGVCLGRCLCWWEKCANWVSARMVIVVGVGVSVHTV